MKSKNIVGKSYILSRKPSYGGWVEIDSYVHKPYFHDLSTNKIYYGIEPYSNIAAFCDCNYDVTIEIELRKNFTFNFQTRAMMNLGSQKFLCLGLENGVYTTSAVLVDFLNHSATAITLPGGAFNKYNSFFNYGQHIVYADTNNNGYTDIYYSTNGGISWTPCVLPSLPLAGGSSNASDYFAYYIGHVNGTWVMVLTEDSVGHSTYILTSVNGINFVERTRFANYETYRYPAAAGRLYHDGTTFYIFGMGVYPYTGGNTGGIFISSNGADWSLKIPVNYECADGTIYNNKPYALLGSNVYRSDDNGNTWSNIGTPPGWASAAIDSASISGFDYLICWGFPEYYNINKVGLSDQIVFSTDGITFSRITGEGCYLRGNLMCPVFGSGRMFLFVRRNELSEFNGGGLRPDIYDYTRNAWLYCINDFVMKYFHTNIIPLKASSESFLDDSFIFGSRGCSLPEDSTSFIFNSINCSIYNSINSGIIASAESEISNIEDYYYGFLTFPYGMKNNIIIGGFAGLICHYATGCMILGGQSQAIGDYPGGYSSRTSGSVIIGGYGNGIKEDATYGSSDWCGIFSSYNGRIISSNRCVVLGGKNNFIFYVNGASSHDCAIISGMDNKIWKQTYDTYASVIVGGMNNTILNGRNVVVVGGFQNDISWGGTSGGVILGGEYNGILHYNCISSGKGSQTRADCDIVHGNTGTSPNVANNTARLTGAGEWRTDVAPSQPESDYAEMFEWDDGNTTEEDRVGFFVKLVDGSEKIDIFDGSGTILGIVSATPGFKGNVAPNKWCNTYLKDDWGRKLFDDYEKYKWNEEDVEYVVYKNLTNNNLYITYPQPSNPNGVSFNGTIPEGTSVDRIETHGRINPSYDPEQEYLARDERPEWSPVGLLGQIYARASENITGNFVTVGNDGMAKNWISETIKYSVLSIIKQKNTDDYGIVKVLFK